jgi:preprotein translocase subunit Sss1
VIVDQIQQFIESLVAFSETFIIPDWGELVGLLPILLLIGVVGPIVTLLAIFWLRYGILKPRVKVGYADARRPAAIGADGLPVFPRGEPYSLAERMIYEPGASRSVSGDELLVECPKCGLVRSAAVDTCGNCGLSFTIAKPTRSVRPAAPPPGGRAAV